MLRLAVFTAFLIASLVSSATAQTPVTACGQVVDGSAVLSADLDCSAYEDGPGIEIRSGTLDLGGYTLSGNETLVFEAFGGRPAEAAAIWCSGKCTVLGPGTVVGGSFAVISASARALVSNVAVNGGASATPGNGKNGIVAAPTARLTIDSSIVTGHLGYGTVGNRLDVRNSTISGNGQDGLLGDYAHGVGKTKVRNSVILSNGLGPMGGGLFAGIRGNRVIVRDSVVSDNAADGITARGKVAAKQSTLERNGRAGVRAVRNVKLKSCVLADNLEADIDACKARVKDTQCQTSANSCDGGSLGICSLD